MNEERPSFEEILKQVGAIARRLETGELPLEDAIKEFERGTKLLKKAKAVLEEARAKLEVLTSDGRLEEVDPGEFLEGKKTED